MTDTSDTFAGFITLVGKPNVGKSTLLNGMLGSAVAPVTSKPQTTRRQLRGIYSSDKRQIVFVDTPGLHEPADHLDTYMQKQIREALDEVDLVLWLVDLRHPATAEDALVADQLKPMLSKTPVWLVGNKVDAATRPQDALKTYSELLPDVTRTLSISAQNASDTDSLRAELLLLMPAGHFLYPTDYGKSDQTVSQWSAEMIRQAAMQRLRQEIPYAVAVKVQTFEERAKGHGNKGAGTPLIYCKAFVYVEREAHKPMVIGHNGQMLKSIGLKARKSMEAVLGKQVYLDLEVQVYPNWRKDREALRELEYQ